MALQGLEARKAELDVKEAAITDIESAAKASMAASQATTAKQQVIKMVCLLPRVLDGSTCGMILLEVP